MTLRTKALCWELTPDERPPLEQSNSILSPRYRVNPLIFCCLLTALKYWLGILLNIWRWCNDIIQELENNAITIKIDPPFIYRSYNWAVPNKTESNSVIIFKAKITRKRSQFFLDCAKGTMNIKPDNDLCKR